MYPISQAFRDQLSRSHSIHVIVEVYNGPTLLKTLDTVTAGNVNVDNENSVRRRCQLTIAANKTDLVPSEASDLFMPYGNEIKIRRGVVLLDGTIEYVPLGVFGIAQVRLDDGGESLNIQIDGYDRARRVQRARFTAPYIVARDTNYVEAIKTLLDSRVAGLTYNFANSSELSPDLVFEAGSDPWEAATKMAKAIGMNLFFGPEGVCTLQPKVDPTTAPIVMSYREGRQARLLYVNKTIDDEQTYNGVIVTGESSGETPVRAEAWDENPASPTYRFGPFGEVPYFFTSSFIRTQEQAQAVADSRLLSVLGTLETIRISALVNPAHDVDDVIEIVRSRSRIASTYVIEGVTIPLEAAQPMPLSVKRRKVI